MVRYEKIIKGFTTMINKLEALALKAEGEEAAATVEILKLKDKAIAAETEKNAALKTADKIKELIS